jgi:hypothetical protein
VGLVSERRVGEERSMMEREPNDRPIRRSKGFIFQNADKRRALDFTEGRDPKKFLHRQMQDFSEAELQELQHKVKAWVRSPRVMPTYPETVTEEY